MLPNWIFGTSQKKTYFWGLQVTISGTRLLNKKLAQFFTKVGIADFKSDGGFLNCQKYHKKFGLLLKEKLLQRTVKNRQIWSHCDAHLPKRRLRA